MKKRSFVAFVAGMLVGGALGPLEPAFGQREPIAARVTPLRAPIFACTCTSEHFNFAADELIALEPLAWIAEEARRRTRAWLGMTEVEHPARVHVYFTDELDALYALEERHGIAPSRAYHADHPFSGRCYPEAGLVVIPYRQPDQRRWQLVHEVVHTIFQDAVGRNVPVVNEGLAEILPYWILYAPLESPEVLDAQFDQYDRRCAKAVLAREVPSLANFARIEPSDFYDARAEWLEYALAWKLVKVLVESDRAQMQGRFPRLLRTLGDGNDLWPALRSVYDTGVVEALWLAEIDRAAPWRPLFGAWSSADDVLIGNATSGHSACVVTRDRVSAGQPFALAFTLERALPPNCAVGFAIEVQGEDDFVYVEFRPQGRQIAVARRASGTWVDVIDYRLPDEPCIATPSAAGHRVELDARRGGVLVVSVDGIVVMRHALSSDFLGGALGLMLERCAGEEAAVAAQLSFRRVSITR